MTPRLLKFTLKFPSRVYQDTAARVVNKNLCRFTFQELRTPRNRYILRGKVSNSSCKDPRITFRPAYAIAEAYEAFQWRSGLSPKERARSWRVIRGVGDDWRWTLYAERGRKDALIPGEEIGEREVRAEKLRLASAGGEPGMVSRNRTVRVYVHCNQMKERGGPVGPVRLIDAS